MAESMEVSLPQTMLQNLLDLLKLESLKFCLKIHVHVVCHICYQVNIDYHNQHESAALIGLFHMTFSVLPSVESYPIYRKPMQRGVQGYPSSLQWREEDAQHRFYLCGCNGCISDGGVFATASYIMPWKMVPWLFLHLAHYLEGARRYHIFS